MLVCEGERDYGMVFWMRSRIGEGPWFFESLLEIRYGAIDVLAVLWICLLARSIIFVVRYFFLIQWI